MSEVLLKQVCDSPLLRHAPVLRQRIIDALERDIQLEIVHRYVQRWAKSDPVTGRLYLNQEPDCAAVGVESTGQKVAAWA